MMRRTTARATVAALAAVVLALGAGSAMAQDGDDTFTLAEGVTHEGNLFAGGTVVNIDGIVDGNLFVGGVQVTIRGTVRGDVFAGGTKVVLDPDGVIEGDLMAGGTQVDVAGTVFEDVRVGGYVVRIVDSASVEGEVMAGGYAVQIDERVAIAEDLYVGAYQLAMDGQVGRNALIGAQAVDVSGTIEGDATIEYGDPASNVEMANPGMMFWRAQVQQQGVDITWPTDRAPGLRMDDGAEVGGALTLRGPVEVEVPEDAVAGETEFEPAVVTATGEVEAPRTTADALRGWLVSALKRYLALLLVGALAVALAPRLLAATARQIDRQPLPSTGWGCLSQLLAAAALVALGIALILVSMVLAAAQMGGTLGWLVASVTIVSGVLLTFGMVIVAWVAQVAVGLWLGRRAVGRPDGAPWLPLAVGLLPVALLVTLPAVGLFFKVLAISLGLGALALSLYRARRGPFDAPEAVAIA